MLDEIISKIEQNKEWVFSGIGVLAISAILGFVKLFFKRKSKVAKQIFKQINRDNSQGTQIGIQINRMEEADFNGKERE